MGTVFNVAISVITVYALLIGGVILWAWLSKDGEPPQAEKLYEAEPVTHVYYNAITEDIIEASNYHPPTRPEVAYLGTL